MKLQTVPTILCTVLALFSLSCTDETQQPTSPAFEPQLAQVGPVESDCDVKGLPVRDYFLDREDRNLVKEQLRNLSTACEDRIKPKR